MILIEKYVIIFTRIIRGYKNEIKMERIGILGGTFNPVHSEHVKIAEHAVKELNLDVLFIMPTFLSPHKTTVPASGTDRINMLRLAFCDSPNIEISDYEIEKQGKSYTYQTVEEFSNRYKGAKLYFICGGDMLTDFKTWRYPERILDSCELAVFSREDYFTDYIYEREYFKKTFGKTFIKLNYVGKVSSSTKIRVYSSFSLPTEFAIPEIQDYIVKNNLYYSDIYTDFIKKNLKPSRVKHTADVVITALKKAKELGLDMEKVRISATLHDCAKYLDKDDFKDFKLPNGVPKPVEHAFLGAYVAEKILGIKDEEILDAIRYHTSGKANMSTLSKLIFVADMVEEGRNYEGVEELRELYKGDFEKCFTTCLKEETLHLKNKGQEIYIETLNAYNYYVKD